MKKQTLLMTAFLMLSSISNSQDLSFSQTTTGNVYLNTALVGNDTQARLASSYRSQWYGLGENNQTTMLNFYQYIPKTNAYGGMNLMLDNQMNILQNKSVSLFYTQNIKLKGLLIKPSIEAGYTNRSIDWSKVTFGDMIDPQNGFIYQTGDVIRPTVNYFDLNLGTVFYFKNLLVGLSAHHLNKPSTSFFENSASHLPVNYGVQLSYVYEFNKLSVAPFAYYNKQNGFQQLVPGVRFMYNNHFNFALSTRSGNDAIFNLGYQNKWLMINYSYDMSLSRLNNEFSGSAHELGLAFRFWNVKAHDKFMEVKSVF
jgi:type IX secretion system PorP/SprF family membrane protein